MTSPISVFVETPEATTPLPSLLQPLPESFQKKMLLSTTSSQALLPPSHHKRTPLGKRTNHPADPGRIASRPASSQLLPGFKKDGIHTTQLIEADRTSLISPSSPMPSYNTLDHAKENAPQQPKQRPSKWQHDNTSKREAQLDSEYLSSTTKTSQQKDSITEVSTLGPVHRPSQVHGATSWRRSIRATLSPPPPNSSTLASAAFIDGSAGLSYSIRRRPTPAALTHPTLNAVGLPPQTPHSLLRQELDAAPEGNQEESLLCSPLVEFVPRTTFSQASSSSILPVANPVDTPANTANSHETGAKARQPILSSQLPHHKGTPAAVQAVSRKKARFHDTPDTPGNLDPLLTVEMAVPKAQPRPSFQEVAPLAPPESVVRSTRPPRNVARAHVPVATPFPSRGKGGVCMDLSDMFFDAASHRKPKDGGPALKMPMSHSKVLNKPQTNKREPDQLVIPDWADKQCDSFTTWLNYTFQPSEDKDHETSIDQEEQPEEATGVDRAAFRTLVLHRRQAQARIAALQVFHSDDMSRVRNTIMSEIVKRRIAVRSDRDMYADLPMRQQILQLLLSYSTPWLRLGLETLFGGEVILPHLPPNQYSPSPKKAASRQTPLGRVKMALKTFIVNRVLFDEMTLEKYTKGLCKVPSGKFEVQYREELRTLVLYRLLVLIFFLDKAKEANVLPKFPRLFSKEAAVKSSRDVLLSFCRDFLSAEGDFIKHLSRIGLKVHYRQEAVDELDFKVDNLAVDLRDGVRLVRMTEILTGAPYKSLLLSLRIPAVSRLQKLHNVGVALQGLREFGVPVSLDIAPHHIVDGHREMVLKLMWSVMSHCCLKDLIHVEQVEAEIQRLERNVSDDATMHEVLNDQGEEGNEAKLKSVLLRWCQAVCRKFQVRVDNLTTALSDGHAICLLIHYYHPNYLRRPQIKETLSGRMDPRTLSEDEKTRLLLNERANNRLANRCMSDLGGIPQMIPICDSSNPPEEKSMLLCLAFLCSRLLESDLQVRSCVVIQNWYRRFLSRRRMQKQKQAALKIMHTWRERKIQYLFALRRKYMQPVRVIEAFIRTHHHRLMILRESRRLRQRSEVAATRFQACFRRFAARRRYASTRRLVQAIIVFQSRFRKRAHGRTRLLWIKRSISSRLIQRTWRSHRDSRYSASCAANSIQRLWRGFWAQLQYQIDRLDIVTVQSCVRRHLAKKSFQAQVEAACHLQQAVRLFLQRKQTKSHCWQSAITIQSAVRMSRCRQAFSAWVSRHKAAIIIQSVFRCYLAKESRKQMVTTVILIQSFVRSSLQRRCYMHVQTKVRMVQAQVRCFLLSSSYQRIKASAIVCQSIARSWLARADRLRVLTAVPLIQRSIFVFLARSELRRRRNMHLQLCAAASTIQGIWRAFSLTRRFRSAITSLITLQCAVRARHAKHEFCRRRQVRLETSSALRLQCAVRGHLARTLASHQRFSKKKFVKATEIQCAVRAYLARMAVAERREALLLAKIARTVVIQRHWRGLAARNLFNSLIAKAVVVQKFFRGQRARVHVERLLDARLRLQCVLRGFLARNKARKLREERLLAHQRRTTCACCIQKKYRAYLVYRELGYLRSIATKIQKVFRGYLARADYKFALMDIVVAQSVVRRRLAIRRVSLLKESAILLNATFRRHLAREVLISLRIAKEQCRMKHEVSVLLQRSARGHLARRLFSKLTAARMIQKTWRCYSVHVDFMLSILSAIEIQAFARRAMARNASSRRRSAVLKVQAFGRVALARIYRTNLKKGATAIQSTLRCFKATQMFKRKKLAAIHTQRIFRGYSVRMSLEVDNFAATEIQRVWRGYHKSTEFMVKVMVTLKLQCLARRVLARKVFAMVRLQQEVQARLLSRSARDIQATFRRYMLRKRQSEAAASILAAVKCFLLKTRFKRIRLMIIRLQSAFRANRIRRALSRRAKELLERTKRANLEARKDPSRKLGNRTQTALHILLTSTSLGEILKAICFLELSTRLSRSCCEAFSMGGVADILFSLIRSCNRSLPHLELLSWILLTMRNVAKYEDLLPAVATTTGVDVFVDLVQLFRDKDGVFCSAVLLLERSVRFSSELQLRCATKENLKRLKSVHALCARKMSITVGSRRSSASGLPDYNLTRSGDRHFKGQRDLRRGLRVLEGIIRHLGPIEQKL